MCMYMSTYLHVYRLKIRGYVDQSTDILVQVVTFEGYESYTYTFDIAFILQSISDLSLQRTSLLRAKTKALYDLVTINFFQVSLFSETDTYQEFDQNRYLRQIWLEKWSFYCITSEVIVARRQTVARLAPRYDFFLLASTTLICFAQIV